jgi:hypothetical protein
MRINTPEIWFTTPIDDTNQLEGSILYDSMSGASPQYLSTLSGASGLGIEDRRIAGDLKWIHTFSQFSLAAGAAFSNEDDYHSTSELVEAKWWTSDKNTTVAASISPSYDAIASTNNPFLEENRLTIGYLLGVTQVIDEMSIGQFNMTYTNANGYMTDQYKFLDNRPRSRDQVAWLARYNRFIPGPDASLHTDYRYYLDSWGIHSHTIELAWYQPLFTSWILRPGIRYYSQSQADFFDSVYPPTEVGPFYTTDQRMGDFGGFTESIALTKDFNSSWSMEVRFDFLQQRPSWKLGGHESSEIVPFYATIGTVSLTKKFG